MVPTNKVCNSVRSTPYGVLRSRGGLVSGLYFQANNTRKLLSTEYGVLSSISNLSEPSEKVFPGKRGGGLGLEPLEFPKRNSEAKQFLHPSLHVHVRLLSKPLSNPDRATG